MTHDAATVDPEALRERRVLVVIGGGGVVARELPERGRLVIGRALECDVRVDDPAMSRTHAILVIESPSSMALAVESRTGKTRVDGREVAPGTTVALAPGQLVEIGQSRIVVRRDREAVSKSGTTRPMDATRRMIDLAAKSDLPVLLLGETGAGKEICMERIVAGSPRRSAPIVRIDCAALPEQLLESALFGHEEGASAGAEPARAGLFEAANGGTAFLDEVAELPPGTQAKLLRVIESREVTRLGSVTPRPVDVRVIAATNRDLRAQVARGAFREDLYFRLSGVVVSVPPLRDRQDEIADLAREILAAETARAELGALELSEGALALLVAYRWPGNVRELRNVVARAMHLAKDGVIDVPQLELNPPSPSASSDVERTAAAPAASSPAPAPQAPIAPGTPEYERARIVAALERASGNQKEAARILGMTRRMLMYRLDTYGLPRPRKR